MKKYIQRHPKSKTQKILNLSVFVLSLTIPLVFFFLLDRKTGDGFGFADISFSLLLAIIITGFLIWNSSVIIKNPYLGLIIGLIALAAFISGLLLRYQGPYTTTLTIIFSVLVLIYIGYFFLKYRKKEKKTEEFDDRL